MVLESKTTKVPRDPFAVKPLPKAYYHPSKHKNLSKTQKKTKILGNPAAEDCKEESQPRGPEDELFLKGGNRYIAKTPPPEDNASSKFDESWPSSERPSSVGLTGTDDKSPYSLQTMLDLYGRKGDYSDIKQTLSFTETDQKEVSGGEASTLQRYIERFRRGEPMSREDRQRQTKANSRDFWWIDSANRESEAVKKQPVRKAAERSPPDDITQRLQERADKLLERSVSTVASSDPIVSTDGLGSSLDGSASISSFEEQPYRPVFAKNLDNRPSKTRYPNLDRGHAPYPHPPDTSNFHPRVSRPARPEDDILHQWRVKRRLESARDVAEHTPANKNSFGFLSKQPDQEVLDAKLSEFKERLSGKRTPTEPHRLTGNVRFTPVPNKNLTKNINAENMQEFEQRDTDSLPTIASPTLGRRGKQTGVEPHLHLMCDLLPCGHSQQFLEKTLKSHTDEKSDQDSKQSKGCESSRTVNGRDKSDSDSAKEKTETGRYRYLQAERPHDDEGAVKTSSKQSDTENDEDHINKRKLKESKEQESSSDKSDSKESSKRKKSPRDKEDSVPKPRECHSPSMKKFESVNTAIGQVIKDRLFTSSLSTVIDSVDISGVDPNRQSVEFTESTRITPHDPCPQSELSPPDPKPPKGLSAHDSKLRDKKSETRKEGPAKIVKSESDRRKAERVANVTELENEDSYESDGEFPEDQLLQILRAQRSSYEEKLGHIDKLLAELSPIS